MLGWSEHRFFLILGCRQGVRHWNLTPAFRRFESCQLSSQDRAVRQLARFIAQRSKVQILLLQLGLKTAGHINNQLLFNMLNWFYKKKAMELLTIADSYRTICAISSVEEHSTFNRRVMGSNPIWHICYTTVAQLVRATVL